MHKRRIKSLTQLANDTGVSLTTIHNLIHGRQTRDGALVKPGVDTLCRLSKALHIPLHELVYLFAPDAYGAPPLEA